MDAVIASSGPLNGTLALSSDKAICHRAVLVSALADGATAMTPWSTAEDCQRTLEVVRALGVRADLAGDTLTVHGAGVTGLRAPSAPLHCGESGTTMRLACGLLAGQPFQSRLTAGGSLAQRPMRRIVEPLSRMGARFDGAGSSNEEIHPPLIIQGARPLRGMTYTMPVASAQVKSAILLAGLFADSPTTVIEPAATRDHTERMLKLFQADLTVERHAVTLRPPTRHLPSPGRLTIPSDPSSAAFFLVAATLVPKSQLILRDVCLNSTRTHFLKILERMGARVSWDQLDTQWEPRATVTVEHRPLRGTTIRADEVPLVIDELPVLMAAACAAEGETCFEGLHELRVKETDRLTSMTTGLAALGARLHLRTGAGVVIAKSRLRGASVDSFGDHRTAMSLAVAGLIAEGETHVRNAECVAKSFGNFFELLKSIGGSVRLV